MLHHLTVCYSCGLKQSAVLSLVTPSFLMTPLTTPIKQDECELYSQSLEEHPHSDETEPINNSQSLSKDLSPPHLDLTVFVKSSSPEESSNDNGNQVDIISYPESLNQQINLPMSPSKSSNDVTSFYETSNEDLSPPRLYLTVFEKSSATEESSYDNGNDKEVELDIISYPESLNQPINLPMGPSKRSNSTTSLYETSNEDISEKPSPLVSLRYYRFYNYNILDS